MRFVLYRVERTTTGKPGGEIGEENRQRRKLKGETKRCECLGSLGAGRPLIFHRSCENGIDNVPHPDAGYVARLLRELRHEIHIRFAGHRERGTREEQSKTSEGTPSWRPPLSGPYIAATVTVEEALARSG